MQIGIIGSGVSGLGAAWLLHRKHEITVFEAEDRIGGHSNTIEVNYDGMRIPVDTGFIVYNEANYPNLMALFNCLEVATEASDMSFALSSGGGAIEWASGNLDKVFAQRRNVFSPKFLSTIKEIWRFNKTAPADLANGVMRGRTLKEYLDLGGYSPSFRSHYLFPMGGAIWSMPNGGMQEFPAESFVSFCHNHSLMSPRRPRWRTVSGGSREYVKKLIAPFSHRIRTGAPVTGVHREKEKICIRSGKEQKDYFDHVIIAAHSDQALAMLSDATAQERDVLGRIRYAPNLAYVHRDPALMPRLRKVWSSWNYISGADTGQTMSVSYWMNRLQNIDAEKPLFITLNPIRPPAEELTFAAIAFDHVQYDMPGLDAQRRLSQIQGARNIWFCGAWTGHGFHEDGLCSGLEVAEHISGLIRPWARTSSSPLLKAAE